VKAGEAQQLARRQLSYGHFRPSATLVWVCCPRCPLHIEHAHVPWATAAQKQAGLRDGLVAHLREAH
jgi:hypothetical protein